MASKELLSDPVVTVDNVKLEIHTDSSATKGAGAPPNEWSSES